MWKMLLVWAVFAIVAMVVHVASTKLVLKQKREDGKFISREDFVFKDNRFVLGVAFLWLMLSSMSFGGTFVWILPINVVLIALVCTMGFGLVLKDIDHPWSRIWTLLVLGIWALGYLSVFVSLNTLDYTQLSVLAEKGSLLYNVFPLPMVFMLLSLLIPFGSGADAILWRSFLVTFLSTLWIHTFFFSLSFWAVLAIALLVGIVASFLAFWLQKLLES
jgi:hypothetical protein